jgi:large subunit ribosomal protein L13Ae
MCTKRIVVDALHHMFGRLFSIIAKGQLNSQKAMVVLYEDICMSAGLVRQRVV